MYEHFSF